MDLSSIETVINILRSEIEDSIDLQLSTDSLEFEEKTKFQKELSFNKLLPYANQLDTEADDLLSRIKGNLGQCVMIRDVSPGSVYWTVALNKYIYLYGLRFTKQEHINFIKLLYDLTTIPNLESSLVEIFASTLTALLKKKELLPPKDLELAWEPLYKLCLPFLNRKPIQVSLYRYSPTLEGTIESLIYAAKTYFPVNATQEILDELRPRLCPFETRVMLLSIKCLKWFLPTDLTPEYHSIGHQLWFNEFMHIWEVCHNAPIWENDLMWIMAKLASRNIGYIDWEPYLPIMFTRFVRCLNLPVTYKKIPISSHHKMEMAPIGEWIASVLGSHSSAQSYLDKFLKTIETYFHPANFGLWLKKLEDLFVKLSLNVVNRLHREQYSKKTWRTPILENYKLTDNDIDVFVNSMMPVAMTGVFNKRCSQNFCHALQYLSIIRPNLVIPSVLEKVYPSLGSDIEPHKLITAMVCMVSISRPLVQGSYNVNKDYVFQEGPLHVLPLLFSSLPGIDPNDPVRCFVTFRLIATYVMMIPIVDCSKSTMEMSEEERMICEETSRFEDFILQFMDKVFILIESSAVELVRLENASNDNNKSSLETMAENALFGVFTSLLLQTSDAIFTSALNKLRSYIVENILEYKVAGQLVAVLCRVFSRINGKETLHALLPFLMEKILNIIKEGSEILEEENLDNEFLYTLLLLHRVVETNGTALLPFIDSLVQVIDKVIRLKSSVGHQMGCQLLKNVLYSLCTVSAIKIEKDLNNLNYPYYKDWGTTVKVKESRVVWYTPGEEEINVAKKLFSRYFYPTIKSIEDFIVSDGKSLTRDELKNTLKVINKIIEGCDSVLPIWDEQPIVVKTYESCASSIIPIIGDYGEITMQDGSNVKYFLVQIMEALQNLMLKNAEDDTKSLCSLGQIWHILILGRVRFSANLDMRRRHFRISKKTVEDKLVGNKGYMTSFLLERVDIQHEFRKSCTAYCFTETHKSIMINLLKLSTSKYSRIRIKAQNTLIMALDFFPYAFTTLAPFITEVLGYDTESEHEAYKGILYLLVNNMGSSLITKKNWNFLKTIWPALILSQPSEKPSVIRLKDYIIDTVTKSFLTSNIFLEIPDNCINSARYLWQDGIKPTSPMPTEIEIKSGIEKLKERGECNLQIYNEILDKLLNAILEKNLHWRHRLMAMNLIVALAHPEQTYPSKVIRYFIGALIHDSLDERKIALKMATYIFKQLKRKHVKVNIQVPSNSNEWLQYNYDKRPVKPEDWDEPRFINKHYVGYYTWPKKLEVYAPSSQQPSLVMNNRILSEEENEVHLFFNQEQNIKKLINYLSLEEKKGRDKFNCHHLLLFKGLFYNYGDAYLKYFIPHLEKLITDKQESVQRCAAELTCGLIRGCKHWPYEMTEKMWATLTPIIRTALCNLTVETIADWTVCFTHAHKDRDPHRIHWLIECLMEEPALRQSEASFVECGRLLILQSSLAIQSWKVNTLFQRLLVKFETRFLENPFQNVRDRLASALVSIFQAKLQLNNGNTNVSLDELASFIDKIFPNLKALVDVEAVSTDKNDEKREKLLRLFQTICKWMHESMYRSYFGGVSDFYKIFPIICQLENNEQDEELSKTCSKTLAVLSQAFTLPEHIPSALDAVEKISKSQSWTARSNCAEFLQALVFHNMSILLSNKQWIDMIQNIVLRLLEDENVQVREKAAQVLGGLLHCSVISDKEILLNELKKKANTKIHKNKNKSLTNTVRNSEMINALRLRHAGVLGMCAFINAHPYDVPSYVPPIFECLGSHLNDPEPVPTTIRKIVNDFKRTHCDGWTGLQGLAENFTEEQFAVLQDLAVPPSYYA